MLLLDFNKRYILPKIFSQHFEINVENFKKYDEQLNLTRSSIKNRSLEITKEFKEFKFHQNLRVHISKDP